MRSTEAQDSPSELRTDGCDDLGYHVYDGGGLPIFLRMQHKEADGKVEEDAKPGCTTMEVIVVVMIVQQNKVIVVVSSS